MWTVSLVRNMWPSYQRRTPAFLKAPSRLFQSPPPGHSVSLVTNGTAATKHSYSAGQGLRIRTFVAVHDDWDPVLLALPVLISKAQPATPSVTIIVALP